mmetsp:Transcript_85531/g.151389  ORF Transcript_85531/g.151389 Transcript_85531/m.151389 type:complete len:998 (+) Transcript_85531:44-3037(+)
MAVPMQMSPLSGRQATSGSPTGPVHVTAIPGSSPHGNGILYRHPASPSSSLTQQTSQVMPLPGPGYQFNIPVLSPLNSGAFSSGVYHSASIPLTAKSTVNVGKSLHSPCLTPNQFSPVARSIASRSSRARRTVTMNSHANDQQDLKQFCKQAKGPKSPELEKFLKESLLRDRACQRAHLIDSDLSAIVDAMGYFEFDRCDDGEGVSNSSGYVFVVDKGSFEVVMSGTVVATLARGGTFGWGSCGAPTESSIHPCEESSALWGVSGQKIHELLRERNEARMTEYRKVLDSVDFFSGLSARALDHLATAIQEQVFGPGEKVVSKGDLTEGLYFVRSGRLQVVEFQKTLGPGEKFGERSLLNGAPRSATVTALTACDLLLLEAKALKEVVGKDLNLYVERSLARDALRTSQTCKSFVTNATTAASVLQKMDFKMLEPHAPISLPGFLLLAVVRGTVIDRSPGPTERKILPGQCMELSSSSELELVAGPEGAKIGVLSESVLEGVLTVTSPSNLGPAAEPPERMPGFAQKMMLVKKVPIFRQLSQLQTEKLVKSLEKVVFKKDQVVIRQGEPGTQFFVIVTGEVTVTIDKQKIRTLGANSSFGERALLFDERRTATIYASSDTAELWGLEKTVFLQIITKHMRTQLEYRISIQDANVTLGDLKPIGYLGSGAFSTVRLVDHKKTKARYALKTCKKTASGKMPAEMQIECDILAENDHPFIMYMVGVFETKHYVSMLTEILMGGELWSALRNLPYMLSRKDARFYAGSILIGIEALWDRNIVYRDLKPENVMLDTDGYVKIIDFGVSKKLKENQSRTYTTVGTPHYMAPEVIQGKGYGVEVDLWSLGVMIFEFVCGHLPFGNDLDEPRAVCAAVLRGHLKFPKAYKDAVGQQLIRGLLSPTPHTRQGAGAGANGLADVRAAAFFDLEGDTGASSGSLFDKLMGRELDPPWTPTPWRPPPQNKLPTGYAKEQNELFAASQTQSASSAPTVVKHQGFFCRIFRH